MQQQRKTLHIYEIVCRILSIELIPFQMIMQHQGQAVHHLQVQVEVHDQRILIYTDLFCDHLYAFWHWKKNSTREQSFLLQAENLSSIHHFFSKAREYILLQYGLVLSSSTWGRIAFVSAEWSEPWNSHHSNKFPWRNHSNKFQQITSYYKNSKDEILFIRFTLEFWRAE